jgi:protocatechuate 3,4-dioxygenase beta subunit
MLAPMEQHLVELLLSRPAGCRLWPEQTEGPYHRDAPRERADITEDRPGVPLRLGLRLLAVQAATPLAGILVEVWHADHEGRYSGFKPFQAKPGQIVTSESVPREIVAPGETFLRGAQRTDEQGMCAFRTIYPGWYSSRTVHIHLRAHLGARTATTQLYFPDEVTDDVFTAPPYASRLRRDTTNDTDSIFTEEGGEEAVLDLVGSVTAGYTGALCFGVAAGEE